MAESEKSTGDSLENGQKQDINDPAVKNLISGLFSPSVHRVAIKRHGDPADSTMSEDQRHDEVINEEDR